MKDTHHTPEWRKRVEGMKKDSIIKIRPLMAGGGYPDPHAIGYNQAIDDLIPIIEEAVAEFAREVEKGLRLASLIDTDEGMVSVKIGMSKIIETVHALAKERGTDL